MMCFTIFIALGHLYIIKIEEVLGQNSEEHYNLFQQAQSHNHL